MINEQAPVFDAPAYVNGIIEKVKLSNYKGKWVVLFFYPEDFSYVCPTELAGFAEDYEDFKKLNTEIIAMSTDSTYVHEAWVKSDPTLKNVEYPLVSDRNGKIAANYGVLNELTGNAVRGLFIIDPIGVIRYVTITDTYVGRSTKETYRVLAALQTGKMCSANWKPGDATIQEKYTVDGEGEI